MRSGCDHCGLPAPRGERFCCYGCELAASVREQARQDHGELHGTLCFVTILSMVVMMLSLFLYAEDVFDLGADTEMAWMRHAYRWASLVLATPVMGLAGWPLARRAVSRLRHGRPSMEALIALGSFAAYGLSTRTLLAGGSRVYFEAATTAVTLATFGRYLEATARSRASRSLGPLLEMVRGLARVRGPDGHHRFVAAAEVEPGMHVEVDVEQVVPVDLELECDAAEVDMAVLTGESRTVTVLRGDTVPAGAVSACRGLAGKALRSSRDSALERLASLARSLLEGRSPVLVWADRFAGVLAPLACLAAVITGGCWTRAESLETGIVSALSVLLVACPCAYAIASPLVFWLALRRAFTRGVLIRRVEALEPLASATRVAFDKTGTLTRADPSATIAWVAPGTTRDEVMGIARAMEEGSSHPVACALVSLAGETGPVPLANRRFLPGRGVTAQGSDGSGLFLGTGEEGRLVLTRDGAVLATFHLHEELRSGAIRAIRALRAQGLPVFVLSGDQPERVEAVGQALGIPAWGRLDPELKVARVRALGPGTAMVGDGLNDAPVLAAGLASFTIAGAAPLAKGVAQVTLLTPDLELVPWTLALARQAVRRVRWLIACATIYNLLFVILAATGSLRPAWAGLSMLTSSLLSLGAATRIGGPDSPDPPDARAPAWQLAPGREAGP